MTPYYSDSAVTLYCGDSRDILPELSGIDLTLTDPPFGVAGSKSDKTKYSSDFEDTPEYIREIVVPIVKSCIEISHSVVLTPGNKNLFEYPNPQSIGCFFYPAGAGLCSFGFISFQAILYYGKWLLSSGSLPTGISSNEHATESGHPCAKPYKAWSWLLKRSCLPGNLVLDPFAGSGTTLVAAKNYGCKSIGIELSERYCEIAANRLRNTNPLFEPEPLHPATTLFDL